MNPSQEQGREREGGTRAKVGRIKTMEREGRENESFGIHHTRNKGE